MSVLLRPLRFRRVPKHVEQLLILAGIRAVRDLESWSEADILNLDRFDEKLVVLLKQGLGRDGYNLGDLPNEDVNCYRFVDPWNPK